MQTKLADKYEPAALFDVIRFVIQTFDGDFHSVQHTSPHSDIQIRWASSGEEIGKPFHHSRFLVRVQESSGSENIFKM